MIIVNNQEVIRVTNLYEFAENGILGSARVVMDEADDFYRQIKAVGIDKVTLIRKTEFGNDITFPAQKSSMELRAITELVVREIHRLHDFKNPRLSTGYFELPITATEYLTSKGLIDPFDLDSGTILSFEDIMKKYAKRLPKKKVIQVL